MSQQNEPVQIVMMVLSVGAVVFPVLFGFVIWKMMKIFVTKEQFEDYKTLAATQRQEVRDSLIRIDRNVESLLIGADRRRGKDS